MFVVEC